MSFPITSRLLSAGPTFSNYGARSCRLEGTTSARLRLPGDTTMSLTRVIGNNHAGRDLVVGDVHGCFRTLDHALSELRFDLGRDRLFGVGDLVNRGPHSEDALTWLEDRFHAVALGNHERPIRDWFRAKTLGSRERAQGWLRKVNQADHERWYGALANMPLALTIETPYGAVGVIHAQVPHPVWSRSLEMLSTGSPRTADIAVLGFETEDDEAQARARPVEGVRVLVHGHWPVKEVETTYNRSNIDTGAGHATLNRLSLIVVNEPKLRTWTFDIDES